MSENRVPHILAGDDRPASAVEVVVEDLGILPGMNREDDASVARVSAGLGGAVRPVQER